MVFPASAKVLAHADSVQLVTLRFLLVSLSFGLIFMVRPSLLPRLSRSAWLRVLVCGVLAVPGSQLAVVQAQRYLSAPLASLLPTFAPAIAAVLAALFLGERLRSAQSGGFLLALVGVVLILVLGAGTGVSLHARSPLGAAIGLITPLSWAAYTLAVRPLSNRASPLGVVGLVYVIGTAALAPAFPHALRAIGHLTTADWVWLALMASAGTLAPNVLWLVSLRRLSVSRTTAFMYLIPVFATLWTLAVLQRAPELIALPGGLLVVIGVALTQLDRSSRSRAPLNPQVEAEPPLGQVILPR